MGMDIYSTQKHMADIPQEAQEPLWSDPKLGYYCRYNIWGWSEMMKLIELANLSCGNRWNLEGWYSNSGVGLHTVADCLLLAACLESMLRADSCTQDTLDHVVGWNSQTGDIVEPRPCLRIKGIEQPVFLTTESVWRFIDFLRNCGGGFEIC